MEAKFEIDCGQPKVLIDGAWNALSLFLESDSSMGNIRKHIELKKTKKWMGNTSTIQLINGSKFTVSTELGIDAASVEVFQKQLLELMNIWELFTNDRQPRTIHL